jgi:hypothetical protein
VVNKHLFVIGAQRSGTTYLWKILDSHPDVYMAKPAWPEPKYFLDSHNVSEGYENYRKTYFEEAGEVAWLGEKSTSYIESEKAARAIKHVLPDATIMVMLRNPIERAISNYNFTKDNKLETYDIERAIKEEPFRKENWQLMAKTSVTPYAYAERGKYSQYLEFWERHFGRDNLILIVAEQFMGKRSSVTALYERLGIDSQFVPPSLEERVNARDEKRDKSELSDEFRMSLQEMFRPWNRQLEERYGLDLSCWERGV